MDGPRTRARAAMRRAVVVDRRCCCAHEEDVGDVDGWACGLANVGATQGKRGGCGTRALSEGAIQSPRELSAAGRSNLCSSSRTAAVQRARRRLQRREARGRGRRGRRCTQALAGYSLRLRAQVDGKASRSLGSSSTPRSFAPIPELVVGKSQPCKRPPRRLFVPCTLPRLVVRPL